MSGFNGVDRRRPTAKKASGALRWALIGALSGCAASLLVLKGRAPAGVGPSRAATPLPAEPAATAADPVAGEFSRATLALTSPRALENGSPFGVQPEPASVPGELDVLVATARTTNIYAQPSFEAARVGYLRGGQVVARGAEPVLDAGCPGGFYSVQPTGYVCAGPWASVERDHPARRLLPGGPDRTADLPYRYGISKFPTPPLYSRIPSYTERTRQEPELHYHVRHQAGASWRPLATDPLPLSLQGHGSAPRFDGGTQDGAPLVSGRAIPNSGFAFLSVFDLDGYQYGLSTDLSVLPLDRLSVVEASEFHGVELNEATTLPIAFVRSHKALLFAGDPHADGLRVKRPLDFREAVPLSGNRVRLGGKWYRETTWGDWLVDHSLVVVEPLSRPPSWATADRRWLDISVLNQTLVAYVGTHPAYVTLVSTGKEATGLVGASGTPTVQGTFLIHTKHVSWNMGRTAGKHSYDLREVPYVMYFHEGYALHSTYWHDGFGSPRSHGCINLAPRDARYLFNWTLPAVPDAWYGAFGLEGTQVYIHP